jgi:hypothetical protein
MTSVLRGSCACGRNRYVVHIPHDAQQSAQILLDTSSHSRESRALPGRKERKPSGANATPGRLQASPLTAFLRIPLAWFQSSTIAFFPDETHQTIRRTFSPAVHSYLEGDDDKEDDDDAASGRSSSSLRHQFCGYCGTPLARWDASSREAERFVALTLGSLLDEDVEQLDVLGLLGESEWESDDHDEQPPQPQQQQQHEHKLQVAEDPLGWVVRRAGAPWFEDMVRDSRLGRLRSRRGGVESADGTVSVEMEIVEFSLGEEEAAAGGAKRKLEHEGQEDEMEA